MCVKSFHKNVKKKVGSVCINSMTQCECVPFAFAGEEGEERTAGFFRLLDL